MKVGTDAILLSIWCNISNGNYMLDVGTGSGVIALILATRTSAKVHAVELDKNSAIEAALNFKNCSDCKLSLFHDNFNNFAESSNQKYDLIISNPPFFSNSLLPNSKSRKDARHTSTLTHQQLCKGVSSLLSKNGKFNLVLPYDIANAFINIAITFNLYPKRQLIIYPKPNTKPNRINIEFGFENDSTIITDEITIRNTDNSYSPKYRKYVEGYLTRI